MITRTQIQSRATQVNNCIRAFNNELDGRVPAQKSVDPLRGDMTIDAGDFDRFTENLRAFYDSLPKDVRDDRSVEQAYSDLEQIAASFVGEVIQYEVESESVILG